MKLVRILSLTLALCLVLTGCQMTKTSTQNEEYVEITMPIKPEYINAQVGNEPKSLDPAFAVTSADLTYIDALFEPLVHVDENGKISTGLAMNWSSEKDKHGAETYTITLRDAKWSDGTDITADDYIYSFKRILDKELNSPNAYQLFPIKNAVKVYNGDLKADKLGVSKNNDGDLVIELEGSCQDFLHRLNLPAYRAVNKSCVEKNEESWSLDIKNLVVSGSYKVETWKKGQNLLMTKNSETYRKLSNDGVNFIFKYPADEVKEAFKTNKLDFTTEMPKEATLIDENVIIFDNSSYSQITATQVLEFNLNGNVTSDKNVRKAISMAIDREELLSQMGNGYTAATGIYPSEFKYEGESYSQKLVSTKADIDGAKALLAGKEYTVGVLIDDSPAHIRMAEILSKMCREVGITLKITSQPWTQYINSVKNGDFEMIISTLFSDTVSPDAYLVNYLNNSENNYIGFKNRDYDKAITESYGLKFVDTFEEEEKQEEQSEESKDEKKEDVVEPEEKLTNSELIKKAEKILVADEVAVAPISHLTLSYMANESLSGYKINNLGAIDFTKAQKQ